MNVQELRTVYLFASLDEQQLALLKQSMQKIVLEESESLFHFGERASRFFVVIKGHIKLVRLSADGVEKVIEVISPGQSFAEAIMFMSKQIYPVTAQAIGQTEVLSFENKVFLDILEQSFDTCLRVMCDMSMRLRNWLNEIDNLTLKNATYRLIHYLLAQVPVGTKGGVDICLDVPKHVIASRLSIKPETLSRILNQMTKEGLITVDGKNVSIHNLDSLRLYQ